MPRRSRAQAPKGPSTGPATEAPARSGGAGNAARAQQLQAQGGGSHLDRVQRAFGHHDISGISVVHSSAQADAFGAAAMAQGESITFGSSPDLHTAAHEAAHVVQQRAGVKLEGGMGSEGDRYERNADAVADLVVKGQSAEALLDQFTGGRAIGRTAAAGQGVQRKKKKTVSGNAMARLKHAQAGIEHSKEILSLGAGNQKEALEATNFNSYFRMAAMRDPECWYISPSVRRLASQHPDALTTAKAQLAKGGNCGEHAQVGFEYLRATATGETINRVDVEGLDHAFVMIGDAKTEDDGALVICDPWPTAPTACLWEDHFAHNADKSKLNVRRTAKADGTDIVSVIARGVQLTAKGHAWVNHSLSEDETKEKIEEGTKGDKPWIWQHANAAGRWTDYDYEAEAPAVTTPTQETTGPSTSASGGTTSGPSTTGPSTSASGGTTSGPSTTGPSTTGPSTSASGGTTTAPSGGQSSSRSGGVETARSGQSDQFGRRSPTQPPRRR